MDRRQHRTACRAGWLLLALLLLVPLLARGHMHGTADAIAQPCATCVLADHAPVEPNARLSMGARLVFGEPARDAILTRTTTVARSSHAVRAPPTAATPRFA